jgi:hypothetical protein
MKTKVETSYLLPPELIRALELAEAALADIGDAEREPGDDLAWAEARAAQDLPRIRAVLTRCRRRRQRAAREAFIAECEQCNLEWLVPPAALAQPEGGPTYREIMALRDELDTEGYGTVDLVAFARAVLTRWGSPPIEPVPVSERPSPPLQIGRFDKNAPAARAEVEAARVLRRLNC